MFKKSILIIFVGLCVVIATLVLGWSVFMKTEIPVQVKSPVVSDDNQNSESEEAIDDSSDVKNDSVRKILFAHMNGNSSIWIVNEDGFNLKKIVSENIGNSSSAVLSPKKDKIIYISVEEQKEVNPFSSRPKTFGIRSVDLTTDKSTLLVSYDRNQIGIGHPKFSPDGKQIAYFIQENKKNTIHTITLSNLNSKKIMEFISIYRLSTGDVCWSPDGKKIVYLHDNDICVTDLSGNTQKIVSGGEPEKGGDLEGNEWDIFTIRNLSFSSNGKQIKYTKNDGRFIVDIDGKNNKQLEQIVLEKDENKYINIVELVPNSNNVLVLESWPKGHDPQMQRLLLYDIDSKETKVIYEGDKYYNPKISPDGKFIAVSVSEDYRDKDKEGMYLMNLNGEILEKITPVSYYEILEWR